MKRVGLKWIPIVDAEHCTGCSACVEACGPRCLEIIDGMAVLTYPDKCGSEEHCIEPCPEKCIRMEWVEMDGDKNIGKWQVSGS
jgi:NAD-dependent dihydropyrimidine dehydrogenase PreA subunit